MEKLMIPAFGEENFVKNRGNCTSEITLINNATGELLERYRLYLEENGFSLAEATEKDAHPFFAYKKGNDGVFLNYFPATRELSIVTEESCAYFDYADNAGIPVCEPQLTQIDLVDFGLSYVLRLSDGRFIIIDGGFNFEPDCKKLYERLKKDSPTETPVIAAWIMSHPHEDHYHCFLGFMELYADEVKVEKYILNFPEADDLIHYPRLAEQSDIYGDVSGVTNIPIMFDKMKSSGGKIYMAHTGQTYRVGDAVCSVLATMDDTIHVTQNINATSLIFRVAIAGQVILFTTDGAFSHARLPERYGSYLRSDILQVPHHGFQSGTAEGEIAGYRLIKPRVCLLPVSSYCAYTLVCTYKKSQEFLMTRAGVEEFIAGDPERTLTLPYTPSPYGKKELEENFARGRRNNGSRTWVFTDLNTAVPEDFEFSILNMAIPKVNVNIEIFFEDGRPCIRHIKTTVGACSVKKLNIVGKDVDGDAVYMSRNSLKRLGVPENAAFSVRFMADCEIIVTHKTHSPAFFA